MKRPNKNGWWDWFCGGTDKPERVLLTNGGRTVADDDEWSQVMGREPNTVSDSENYWEGTDTDQKSMPGRWKYVGPAVVAEMAEKQEAPCPTP